MTAPEAEVPTPLDEDFPALSPVEYASKCGVYTIRVYNSGNSCGWQYVVSETFDGCTEAFYRSEENREHGMDTPEAAFDRAKKRVEKHRAIMLPARTEGRWLVERNGRVRTMVTGPDGASEVIRCRIETGNDESDWHVEWPGGWWSSSERDSSIQSHVEVAKSKAEEIALFILPRIVVKKP